MNVPELRAAIIDDETPAREILRELLEAHPNVRVIGEADSVANATILCKDLKPNLLFLDVQMEDGEGFDLLPKIDSLPAIIFVTAFDRFAMRAFEVNEAEITLLRLELGIATEQATAAATLATNLDNLLRLLSERPVSGAPDQIERETLAGAALRFHTAAATARSVLPAISRRLKKLGATDASALPAEPPPPQPTTDPATLAEKSPILSVLSMIAERHLASFSGLPPSTAPFESIYVSESDFPQPVIVRLGGRDPLSTKTRAALTCDDRAVLEEAIALRLDAIAALRPVVEALPEDRLRAMAETAALAERQFRQGAISIALFLESQQGWLETLV